MSYEDNTLQLLDILGTSSNNLSFSSFNKILIFSTGSIIVYYNLKNDTKTFIQYHQDEICLIKFIDESQHYMISIDKNSSPLLCLWDIPSFNCLFAINIKTRNYFNVDSIYLEQIKKDNFLILITSIDCNLIYQLTIQNEICSIDFINHISNIQNEIFGFKTFYNSNDIVIMLKDTIQFYNINQLDKQITLKYNINFPFTLIKNSIRVSTIVNIISFISDKGNCILYDQNGNSKPSIIPFDNDYFTSCEFSGDSLCCGSNNGRIYCYNIYEYKMKYYIDNNTFIENKEKFLLNKKDKSNLNNKNFLLSHSIEQIFIDENFDTILIKSSDNSILLSPITSLIKDTRGQYNFISVGNQISLFTFSNYDNIINIELKPKDENGYENIFYTCSNDQTIMKYSIDYNNSKLTNEYFDIEKINQKLIKYQINNNNQNNKIFISTIKFHPLYKYKLFAGDNKGSLYLFDTNDNIFQYKKYIVGTFQIVKLSFNNYGSLICIGFDTGMNIICDLNNECEYMIRLSEHFLTPNEIEERKLNNQIMSFNYFFQNINNDINDDIILYNKTNNEIEVSKLYFENNNILNKEIVSSLKIQNNIIDIDVHISENYTISLIETKQIIINQINNGEVTAIIDLNNQIEKVYNISLDNCGLYFGLICDIKGIKSYKSNLIIFEIGTGNVQTYINNCFSMSKCKFDYGGKYLVIGGIKGDFSVWKLNKEMSSAINNVNIEMKKNKNFWEQYEIKYNNENDIENLNSDNNNFVRENFDNLNLNNEKFIDKEIQNDNFNLNKSLELEDEIREINNNQNNNFVNERFDLDNNNRNVENVFENNLQNSYQKFLEDKKFKNSDPNFQNNFATRIQNNNNNNINNDNNINYNNINNENNYNNNNNNIKNNINNRFENEKLSSEKNLMDLLKEKPKNKNIFQSKSYYNNNEEQNSNFPKLKNQNKNFSYSQRNNLDPNLNPYFPNKKIKNQINKNNPPKLDYINFSNNKNTLNQNYTNSLREQNEIRIKNIANAINEMLSSENKKEDESIDELNEENNYNNIIKSHNPNNENINNSNLKGYFGINNSTEFYINNKEGGISYKENKNKYPEPDDIDDNLIPEKKIDYNIKYNNINDKSLSNISEKENSNFDINISEKNQSSSANDIDYLDQNIRDFEMRNNNFK